MINNIKYQISNIKYTYQNLKILHFGLSFCVFIFGFWISPAFAQGAIGDYLCEIAESYYLNGRYEDALHEFNKALLADPENIKARKYVAKLTAGKQAKPPVKTSTMPVIPGLSLEEARPSKLIAKNAQEKRGIVSSVLDDLIKEEKLKKGEVVPIKLSGEYQIAFGASSDGFEWKRANGNLNERDYHILSDAALNNPENTFDRRIFDP